MFVLKENPVTGLAEWLFEEEKDDEIKHEIARSTYAGMLHDFERNQKYYAAIKKAVKRMKEEGKTARVLDIGTGSGILAMMAAASGADSVTACEVFRPMAKVAKEVVKRNGLENEIKIVDKRSTEMVVGTDGDLTEKADILVTEIFDSELIGEGVLPTLKHAKQNLLNTGCRIVPSSAKVYFQVAESSSLWKRHKLSELKFPDGTSMKTTHSHKQCKGTAAADELHVDEVDDLRMLSKSLEAIRFDFNTSLENFTDQLKQANYQLEARITSSGYFHCIVLWWDLGLDDEEEIILSMAPKCSSPVPDKVLWRDHWMQAIYFVPEEFNVVEGQTIKITLHRDDYCFWFNANQTEDLDMQLPLTDQIRDIERPLCTCGFHTIWSRERFAMCNNEGLWNTFFLALQKNGIKNVLVFGDASLLPLFVAKFVDQVTYIEFSQMSRNMVSKLSSLNELQHKIKMINRRDIKDEELPNMMSSGKIDAVMAEPFFSTSLLPWGHLTFWYHFSKFQARASPTFFPKKGVLKLTAVQFEDLWKVRKAVEVIEDFKLDAFDEVIKDALRPDSCDEHGPLYEAEPYAVWEYEHVVLSTVADAGTFDFTEQISAEDRVFNGKIKITRDGIFHAFVVWMDFWLDEELNWSTGLEANTDQWVRHSKQGVVFLKDPIKVAGNMEVVYRVVFQVDSCNLLFQWHDSTN